MKYANRPLLLDKCYLERFVKECSSDGLPENFVETAPLGYEIIDGVAVINVTGPIVKNASPEQLFYGYVDCLDIQDLLGKAALDLGVQGAVLRMDTPGGSAEWIMELGIFISEFKKRKPIATFIEGGCFSAGYWLAASTDFIYSTISGEAGSIGVMQAIMDLSKLYASMGVKVIVMKSSEIKGAGTPGTQFTKEQQDEFQRGVDYLYGKFTSWVKGNRPQVNAKVFDASTYFAEEAKKVGLIDGIYSLAETIRDVKLLATLRSPKPI